MRHHARHLWLAVATVGLVSSMLAVGASEANAAPITQTFDFTTANSGVQSFTVPDGVCSVSVDARGAAGGDFGNTPGGSGGRALATLAATPGETLEVRVGGQGGPDGTSADAGAGGLNGGGDGGVSTNQGRSAPGGGGASDVRRAPYGTSDRLVVVGGGGGAGGQTSGIGGTGGGTAGGDGGPGQNSSTGGAGGTQTAGGAGGTGDNPGDAGDVAGVGQGGAGTITDIDAGGGGGWHGGGAGAGSTSPALIGGSGGGGGSGFTPQGAGLSNGFQAGNGQILITYDPNAGTCPPPTTNGVTPPASPVEAAPQFTG